MLANFAVVVEQVQSLSNNEKTELRSLLDKYLIEERREQIYQNYLMTQDTVKDLEFSDDINQLKEMLEE